VRITAGEYLSDTIELSPPHSPATVRILAFLRPGGPEELTTQAFVLPTPMRASFDQEEYAASDESLSVKLKVLLRDAYSVELARLDKDKTLRLSSTPRGRIEPELVTLTPSDPIGDAKVMLSAYRLGGELTLTAEATEANDPLEAGAAVVHVAPTAIALYWLAALGGLLGGALREALHTRSFRLWPRRVSQVLKLGLMGNAGLGAVVGFVVFAFFFGVLTPLKSVAVSFAPGLAVALGIVGGFGGVTLLESLGHFLSGIRSDRLS
jgi:hypothetical protein